MPVEHAGNIFRGGETRRVGGGPIETNHHVLDHRVFYLLTGRGRTKAASGHTVLGHPRRRVRLQPGAQRLCINRAGALATTAPLWNSMRVGMLRMRYLAASSGSASVSTLKKRKSGSNSVATRS